MVGLGRRTRQSEVFVTLLFAIILYSSPAAANSPGALSAFSPDRFHFKSYLHLRYSFIQKESRFPIDEGKWSLRRFKVTANWRLNQNTQFYSQFGYKTHNSSSTDDRVYLQHAYVKLSLIGPLNLKIGQFKPPFGWERFQSDSRIPTVERSQAVNRLIPNGSLGKSFVRDLGIQSFGNFGKLLPAFQYEFAVMTGSGANTKLSDSNFPLIVGRLSYRENFLSPLFNKNLDILLQLANSLRWNRDNDFSKQIPGCDADIFQHFSGRDNRWNYAVILNTAHSQFAAEYLTAEYIPDDIGQTKTRASGWFLEHSCFLRDRWQTVVKYEHFDPDNDEKDNNDLDWLTVGLNYYFNNKHNRIMLNYIVKNAATRELKNNMLVIQLQYFLFGDS